VRQNCIRNILKPDTHSNAAAGFVLYGMSERGFIVGRS